MASIYKRKSKDGKSDTWRSVSRIKGHPSVSKSFKRKQEAEDWGQETDQRIKLSQFHFNTHKQQHTYDELIKRMHADGVLEHHRSFKKTHSQFVYWQKRLGSYALIHVTPDLVGKERQCLLETPTQQGKRRTPGTINRYMAVLSSTFNYAVKRLRWLRENPCTNLLKIKDTSRRDRILQPEETSRLLNACRASKSNYLYPIVLIALTTGARQGEILALCWQDIDFDNRLAHLKETKNGHSRTIALVDSVIEELKMIYQSRMSEKPLVFASRETFGNITIKKSWQEALKRAQISGLRFHDLRHSFCTMAARQGASNLELATAMGHRTLQMLQRYTHLDANMSRKYSHGITDLLNIGGTWWNQQPPYAFQ